MATTGDGKPAQEAFARLVKDHVQPFLKAAGFKKKALVFHRQRDGNYGLVHLQKSRRSTATSVEFTINVGVFSSRLQEGLAALTWVPMVTDVPTEPAFHLRRRVGSLMPQHRDIWWGVRTVADIATAWAAIGPVLRDAAVPFLERVAADEDLRDYWLAKPEGTRSGPEDLALGVLLRDIGPREALAPFLDRVRASAPPRAVGFVGAVERLAASAGLTRRFQ